MSRDPIPMLEGPPARCIEGTCTEPRVAGPFAHCEQHLTPIEKRVLAEYDRTMAVEKL